MNIHFLYDPLHYDACATYLYPGAVIPDCLPYLMTELLWAVFAEPGCIIDSVKNNWLRLRKEPRGHVPQAP